MLTTWMSLSLTDQQAVKVINGVQTAKTTGVARIAHTSEAINANMYSLFGFNGSVYTGVISIYNTISNRWSTLTTLSTPRAYHASAAVGTKLYFGGGANGVAYYNDWFSCDSTTGQTQPLTTPPRQRWYGAATAVGTKIYNFGGRIGSGTTLNAWIDIYDTVAGTWSSLFAPTETLGDRPLLSVIGDDIFVMVNTRFWKFNTISKAWTQLTLTPKPVSTNSSMAALNGIIYTYHGLVASAFSPQLWAYDPVADSWVNATTSGASTPVHLNTLVAINGVLYSTSGSGDVSGLPPTGLTISITIS